MTPSALVLLLALAAPSRCADAPLLSIEARREIPASSFVPVSRPPREVPLALVVEAGSHWTRPGVLERVLGKASAIFGRCGLGLGPAEVTVVRWSAEALRRLNADDPYAGPAQMTVMDEPLLPGRRPAVFLFARSVPSTASAYNLRSVTDFGRVHPRAKSLLNTAWITEDQQTRARRRDEAESFSLFAHELTHLFGNLPHTPASPNLMTEAETPGAKSGDLLEEQCVEIRRLYGL